jgi:hypothetical protein
MTKQLAGQDFISAYVEFQKDTESPAIYHRWCAISMIGAMLGRRTYLPFGDTVLYPNMYMLMLGKAGDRKSAAIKAAKKFCASVGYDKFAATRTTREKFLLDLEGLNVDEAGDGDMMEFLDPLAPKEVYIVADEFDEFMGINNINFIRLFGVLWDYDEELPYRDRVKNSKSVSIKDPTINILGGTTPTNFAMAFPPEILGQGFFSRILLIHGEKNGNQNTMGPQRDAAEKERLVKLLQLHIENTTGQVKYSTNAYALLDDIYKNAEPFHITDSRFESYLNRRFTHLLKLCMIVAVANGTNMIGADHVIYANTMLAYAEKFMPRALGEFGKSKDGEVTNKVMDILHKTERPITHQELYATVASDMPDVAALVKLIQKLEYAGKLHIVKFDHPDTGREAMGYLPKRKPFTGTPPHVNWNLLSIQEKEYTL